jgi:hypothetical protein
VRIALDHPQGLAPLLRVLLGLFVLRAAGQALVAFLDVRFRQLAQ